MRKALRMPFLIRYPQEIQAGTVIDELASNIDIGPTLMNYSHAVWQHKVDGRSFMGLLADGISDWENVIYYRYWMHMAHHDNPAHFGLRAKEYKLICFYGLPLDATGALPDPTPASWEFYDLQHDPAEMNNIYGDPASTAIIEEAKQRLFAIKRTVGDDDSTYPELLERLMQIS
jgi:N-acetylglucosamine-6-sulfatase